MPAQRLTNMTQWKDTPSPSQSASPLSTSLSSSESTSSWPWFPQTIKILAGKLFDPLTLEFLTSQCITVCKTSGIILDIKEYSPEDLEQISQSGDEVVDLGHLTVLPGFVDAHVHSESRN